MSSIENQELYYLLIDFLKLMRLKFLIKKQNLIENI